MSEANDLPIVYVVENNGFERRRRRGKVSMTRYMRHSVSRARNEDRM
jgi:hypothetical protein